LLENTDIPYTEWQIFVRKYDRTLSGKDLLENTDIPYTEWQRFVREYGHTVH